MKVLRLLLILSFSIIISCSNESGPSILSVYGVVLDYKTGDPIEKVQISTNPASEIVLSNKVGRFKIRTPEPGEFVIIARHKDYLTTNEMIAVTDDYHANVSIYMRKKGDTTGGDYEKAFINGTITDIISKTAIENVTVTLEPGGEKDYSDNSGDFGFEVFGLNTYHITFEKSGYQTLSKTIEVNDYIFYSLNIEMKKIGDNPYDPDKKEPPFFDDAIYYWSFDNKNLLNHINNKIEGYESGDIFYNEGYSDLAIGNIDSKSYIGMPDIEWAGLQQFTISCWIKVEEFLHPTGGGLLFWGSIQNGWLGLQLAKKPLPVRTNEDHYFAASVGTIYKGDGSIGNSYSFYEDASNYNIYEWNHFVISYKLGQFDFYINGAFIGSHNQNVKIDPKAGGGLSHQWYYEGNYHLSSTTWMAAEYDELIIYNRHMNLSEVQEIKAFK